ncbi:hypothetical protein GCM10020219_031930 [Nonomuraea dietziae]
MDWYYPVLGVAPSAATRGSNCWTRSGTPSWWRALGIRCVSDQPWVTGAETCELVLGPRRPGRPQARAERLFADMQHLRHEDGSYWTGWQFANRKHFPHERSGYTAPPPWCSPPTPCWGSPLARPSSVTSPPPYGRRA